MAPSHGVSAIQQQCAKRAILCEMIVSGKVCPSSLSNLEEISDRQLLKFPRYTSQSVGRLIDKDKSIETYVKYAKLYEQRDWERVESMRSNRLFKDVSLCLGEPDHGLVG